MMGDRSIRIALILVALWSPCSLQMQVRGIESQPLELSKQDHKWIERTLKNLSLEEKVGQMLQVRYYADYGGFDSAEYKHLRDQIQKYHIGSVVFGMHFNQAGPLRSSPLEAAK